jgi:hypothetical protein
MKNELKVAATNLLLRYSLIGLLLGAGILSENAWSAPASASTNRSGATENVVSVSKSGSEETTKKPKDEGFLGSLVTAIASIIIAILTAIFSVVSAKRAHSTELEVVRLSAKLEAKKNLDLANQKFLLDLQTEYDKDLRNHRIIQYQKLLAWMVNLPKYPKPEPLTVEALKHLSLEFRNWYFAGGGLFLCSNEKDPEHFSEASRERYFDFQEGCRIVLQKIEGKWKFGAVPDENTLRGLFGRGKCWTPQDNLVKLVNLNQESMIKKAATPVANERQELSDDVVELLRSLASELRTRMAEDVLTRQSSFLTGLKDKAANDPPV